MKYRTMRTRRHRHSWLTDPMVHSVERDRREAERRQAEESRRRWEGKPHEQR